MKFIRLDLLTLLISLFILGSCKNQNDIGLPVGGQQLEGSLLVYDDIVVKTDSDNVTLTLGGERNAIKTPLSSLNDNVFGLSESGIAATLNLPGSATNQSTTTFTLPAGTITTDSVVLELRYADGFYGDSLNSRYKINVTELNEKPALSNNGSSNKVWNHGTALLNDPAKYAAFNARPTTPVKIFNILKGAKDTLRAAAPHLRVALKNTDIPNLLFNNPTAITSNGAFQNVLNGIYLSLQRNQASDVGGTMMFNLDSSRVNVYYRADNAGVKDTSVVALTIGYRSAAVTPRYDASKGINTYPAPIKSALASTTSNDVFYLQGLAGLRAKVGFPNIKSMFGTADLNGIAINRAELVITPVPGSNAPPFVAQPLLTMYRLDITKQRRLLPDANAIFNNNTLTPLDARFFGASVFGGLFSNTTREYHFVITGYIDDLLRGKLIDYGTYIGTIDDYNRNTVGLVDIGPTVQTAGRLVAVGSDKTSPYRIKLNVIYSKNN
jgi:hypothetical protein